jgi:hypothetical protein
MEKKVLTEIDVYVGEVNSPKGFEIDRQKIKSDILISHIKNNKVDKNNYYCANDYIVPFSQPLDWLGHYIKDFFKLNHNKPLCDHSIYGHMFFSGEQSFLRNQIDENDLNNSPYYTLIYSLDVDENSCELIIEYDNNKIKNNTWHLPLINNNYILFPSTQKYMISKNTSDQINTFLTINYSIV